MAALIDVQRETLDSLKEGVAVYVGYNWCKVRASTDIKESYGDHILLKIAEALKLESTMGKLQFIPTKLVDDPPAGSYCEFDLVREP